ncbi:MAG: pectinesterase family protein [Acidobacteriaceae bacterium]
MPTLKSTASLAALLLAAAAPLALHAQDSRHVTEPHIPRACTTLTATIAAPNGNIPAASEHSLDTARIQSALDHCTPNHAVILRARGADNVFLTGPLNLRSNVTLVIDANTSLVASRDPRIFDIAPGTCGIVSERGHGCKPLITADNVTNAGIMGAGSIDGRGGATLLNQHVTWWDLAHTAKVTDKSQSVPWLIILRHADNFTLYNITLRNSPGFHVAVNDTNGFTAWGVKIMTPRTARNTDGIDPGSSTNVTITHCFIHTGDDDVAVKSGRSGPSTNISVLHNHFYTGHGMSIGSGTNGGVSHMLVDDLTIDGADNGIRIKSDRSRGGLVHDITYRNVCIRDTKNPLFFTPLYTTFPGNLIPVYRDITLDNVHITSPGIYTFLGADAQHKLGLTMNNVFADDQAHSTFIAKDADITLGPNLGNLSPSGDDVNLQQAPNAHPGKPLACDARFVPFTDLSTAPEMAGTIPPVDHTLYVAADGTGDFSSIQRAIDTAPSTGAVVLVGPGTYHEVLTIDKPNITLRSANTDASRTVVVMNKSAGTSGGTLHSATVNVTGDNFLAENITFQNDFNATHPQLPQGSQALALSITGDRAILRNVRLLGNQDTLYAASNKCPLTKAGQPTPDCKTSRQYFTHCFIAGNVDFIFGNARAVFDHCEIHSTPHSEGFLTAQSKNSPTEDSAYVFDHCTLTADPGVTNVYLGRPWRPYATVIYLNTEMGAHINPAGWREWHPNETHSLDTAYFAEFNSTGPGADPTQREPKSHQLTAQQAAPYQPATFLSGHDNWNPTQAQ